MLDWFYLNNTVFENGIGTNKTFNRKTRFIIEKKEYSPLKITQRRIKSSIKQTYKMEIFRESSQRLTAVN